MKRSKTKAWLVLPILIALAYWFATRERAPGVHEATPAPDTSRDRAPEDPPQTTTLTAAAKPTEPAREAPAAPPTSNMLPPAVLEASKAGTHRVWVDAKYGTGPESLGITRPQPGFDGETRPPQGFVPTPDGKLLVLDSDKKRLVWFSPDGRIERSMPLGGGLLQPADVALAKDGTLIVTDHEGVHTEGVVLYDEQGRVKGKLPQFAGGMMTNMYTVGNDIFATVEGESSIKAGDTSGSASDETPGVYDQEGRVPGHVAPDGQTVISATINDGERGALQLDVIKGEPPVHVFSRPFTVAPLLEAIPFQQSDERGTIYLVLIHANGRSLACIDAKSGEPIGMVRLPDDTGPDSGTPFRNYSVIPSGGVIVQQLSHDGSKYHVFDCR